MLLWLLVIGGRADPVWILSWEGCRGCLYPCVHGEMVPCNSKVTQLKCCGLLVCSLVLWQWVVGTGLSPFLVLCCAGRLWSQWKIWSSHNVYLSWVFNIATIMWTACLFARSQKCCVCSLVNACGFERNVARWGQAHGVCWGSTWGLAQTRQQVALVMCQLPHQPLWEARFAPQSQNIFFPRKIQIVIFSLSLLCSPYFLWKFGIIK